MPRDVLIFLAVVELVALVVKGVQLRRGVERVALAPVVFSSAATLLIFLTLIFGGIRG